MGQQKNENYYPYIRLWYIMGVVPSNLANIITSSSSRRSFSSRELLSINTLTNYSLQLTLCDKSLYNILICIASTQYIPGETFDPSKNSLFLVNDFRQLRDKNVVGLLSISSSCNNCYNTDEIVLHVNLGSPPRRRFLTDRLHNVMFIYLL